MSLVKVKLHGQLGKKFGECWELAVNSVGSAINALHQLTDGAFSRFLSAKERKGAKYHILINGEHFLSTHGSIDKEEDVYKIKDTNLIISIYNLKTIDIVPILEGADSGLINTILGAVLIIVGVVLLIIPGFNVLGVGLIMVGAGLLAAGITALLSKPPTFEDFRDIGKGTKTSYLFNGPENVTREGGPVPVGYGRLLIGSQVIGASYVIKDAGGTTVTYGMTRGIYIQGSPTFYNSRAGDPGYDKFGSLTFTRGYYEINDNAFSVDDFFIAYRPEPQTVIGFLNRGADLSMITNYSQQTSIVNGGRPYAFNPFGTISNNPYPNDFYNEKPYPFGAF